MAGVLRAFDVALQKTFIFTSRDLLTLLRGEGQLKAHLQVRQYCNIACGMMSLPLTCGLRSPVTFTNADQAIRQYCLLGRGDLVSDYVSALEQTLPRLATSRAGLGTANDGALVTKLSCLLIATPVVLPPLGGRRPWHAATPQPRADERAARPAL